MVRSAKPGYIGAMIRKLTNNLQVEFRNIHVRYEDSTSNPDVSPCSVTETLAERPSAPLCCWRYHGGVQDGFHR